MKRDRIAVTMNRIVILSLLLTFSVGNCKINSGCKVKDNIFYEGDLISYVPHISTFTKCATICKKNSECSYWTLIKDGDPEVKGACNLLRSITRKREIKGAISGPQECGEDETKTLSPNPTPQATDCQRIIPLIKTCIEKEKLEGKTEELCKNLLDLLKNCM